MQMQFRYTAGELNKQQSDLQINGHTEVVGMFAKDSA